MTLRLSLELLDVFDAKRGSIEPVLEGRDMAEESLLGTTPRFAKNHLEYDRLRITLPN